MNELKTLKDITWELGNYTYEELKKGNMDIKLVTLSKYKQSLRIEAIKWVKAAREQVKKDFPSISEEGIRAQRSSFMEFFDLSEEDLK